MGQLVQMNLIVTHLYDIVQFVKGDQYSISKCDSADIFHGGNSEFGTVDNIIFIKWEWAIKKTAVEDHSSSKHSEN